jgi:hypothetical protein
MEWVRSYSTIQVDTLDGDIGMNEFAVQEGKYYYRETPKEEALFLSTTSSRITIGRKEVRIIGTAYYDEFRSRSGKIARTPANSDAFKALQTIPNASKPTRSENISVLSPLTSEGAVAYDAASSVLIAGVGSISFNHTAAANATLVVGVSVQDGALADRKINTCTYNAVSMFLTTKHDDATNQISAYLFELHNPSSGVNAIFCMLNDQEGALPTDGSVIGISLTGADPDLPVEAFATSSATSDTASLSITTVSSGSMLIDFMLTFETEASDITPGGTDHTERVEISQTSENHNGGTMGPVSPAGTATPTWTWTGSEVWLQIGLAAKPPCDSAVSCTDVFTSPGTTAWVAPANVTTAVVACWGAGGGGGRSTTAGGAGGGGGAFASSSVSVTPSSSYDVVIGTGGAGGDSGVEAGAAGGDSSFNTTDVVAKGGSGGGAASGANTTGGAGGLASASTGSVKNDGGTGGGGTNVGDTSGGGGGAGGPAAAGANGVAGNATVGGAGGSGNGGNNGGGIGGAGTSGATVISADGAGGRMGGGGGGGNDDGTADGGRITGSGVYGGGGGGTDGDNGENAGNGGNGMCTVTYTATAGGGGDPTPFFIYTDFQVIEESY